MAIYSTHKSLRHLKYVISLAYEQNYSLRKHNINLTIKIYIYIIQFNVKLTNGTANLITKLI